jgi:glycosyltransferase involved in cell wall biosynthesis
LAKIKGTKVIYNVQEIYPDFIINQGLKFKPAIYVLKKMEKAVYNRSDAITTIDSVFYDTILPRFSHPEKLSIIPNFVDNELFKPMSAKDIELNQSYFPEKEDVLKLMYAGNIGHAQDWEPLLAVAKALVHHKIEFWVVGEGVMKEYLEQEKETHNLHNIHLVPYQDREAMPSLIAYADLHFIFMSPEMEGQGFPSKVYTIMACAKPLLVISGKNTPIHNFLESLNCAFLIDETSFNDKRVALVDFLTKAIRDKAMLSKMGDNGYEVIERQYSKKIITQKYVDLASNILIR